MSANTANLDSNRASACASTRHRVSDRDAPLADYFFRSTVAALANDLPPPKMEFYFNGVRCFVLTADEDEFLLLDFEDVVRDVAQQRSKRKLKQMIEDEESLGVEQFVFADVFSGKYESVRAAIDLVCQFFERTCEWRDPSDACEKPFLNAVISRAIIKADSVVYETDRRYCNVEEARGDTMHQLKRQSDRAVALEQIGDVTLSWLRVFALRWQAAAGSD